MFNRPVTLPRLRGLGVSLYTNPDGSPTYDGAPYDPYDSSNPYNDDNQIFGPSTDITSPPPPVAFAPPSVSFTPVPISQYTPPPVVYAPATSVNPAPTPGAPPPAISVTQPSASTPNPFTSLLTSFSSILSPAKPAALTPAQIAAGVKPPVASTGTSTVLILGVAGLAAFLLLRRRRK